jgi:hypothetical protein
MKRADTPQSLRTVDPADLRIDRSARPGWPTGAERLPTAGQHVYCLHGMAEVEKVLGRTGDGSRLLVLRLLDRTAAPFHASASNVLVSPGMD